MMDSLEMLSAREQLMEDIDRIVDDFVSEKLSAQEQLQLVIALCNSVCNNFPAK